MKTQQRMRAEIMLAAEGWYDRRDLLAQIGILERERDEALGLVDRQAALLKRTCEALAEWKDATAEQRDEAFLKTMNLWKP